MYIVRTKRELERKGGGKLKQLQVWPAARIQMRDGVGEEVRCWRLGHLASEQACQGSGPEP
jgi:hypothetical protein